MEGKYALHRTFWESGCHFWSVIVIKEGSGKLIYIIF